MFPDWNGFHEKARQLEKDGKCQGIYQLAIDCFDAGKVSWGPMTCGRAASIGPPTREQARKIVPILLSAGAGNRKYTLQKIARFDVNEVWEIIRQFDRVEQRDMLRDLQEIVSLQSPPSDLAEIRDMSDEQLWRQILLSESPDVTEIAEAIKRVTFPAEEGDLVEKLKTLSESDDAKISDALIQSPNLAMTRLYLFARMSETNRFESLKRQLDESGLFQHARINIKRKRLTLKTKSLGKVSFDKAAWESKSLPEQMKVEEKSHLEEVLQLVQRVLQSAMLAQKGIQWRIEERRPQVTVIEPAEPAAENVPTSATKQTSKKSEGPACLRNLLILKPASDNYIIRPVLVLRSEPSTKEQFET